MTRSDEQLLSILAELRALRSETELVEFKRSYAKSKQIGKYISALANSAALTGSGQPAWMVWGIDDKSHEIVGTDFQPYSFRDGGEDLMYFLQRTLEPASGFSFYSLETQDAKHVVMLEVPAAIGYPVEFEKEAYIRFGANNMLLKESRSNQKSLWQMLNTISFEKGVAEHDISVEQISERLDIQGAARLLRVGGDIYEAMEQKGLIVKTSGGNWNILNLGAILFAQKLSFFPGLVYRAVRIIQYRGTNNYEPLNDYSLEQAGYAIAFDSLVKVIMQWLPREEIIVGAMRYDTVLPETAIRELLANALIHQDFNVSGKALRVEIFSDRMEITNAGAPLIETNRFLDQDRSRNVNLTMLMHQLGFCEQRGSGIDRVMQNLEERQVPAPVFERGDYFTRIILFARSKLKYMTKRDRINACYWHACLRHKDRTPMTNASLRKRLGTYDTSLASRVIRATVEEGLIRPLDFGVGKRAMKYLPAWASDSSS